MPGAPSLAYGRRRKLGVVAVRTLDDRQIMALNRGFQKLDAEL
ncbi:MAG: hypothetical protein QOJ58_3131, partial [Alphaproteobacteria bacterium]|nr:hypothetical protein [Alphaproteobacteria bacterium]